VVYTPFTMTNVGAHGGANRRLSARFACKLAVSYSVGTVWHPATGMDVSTNGCRLRLGEDLTRAASLKVRLEHPSDGGILRAELDGTVIWSRLEGLSFQVGIQFTSDDPHLHELLRMLGSGPVPA
jgi:hypothetical protein